MVHRYTHVVEEMYDRRKKGPLDQTFSRLSLIPSFRTGGRRLFALVADDRARSRKKDDCFFFFLSSVNVDHCEFLRLFSLQDRYIYIYIPSAKRQKALFFFCTLPWFRTSLVQDGYREIISGCKKKKVWNWRNCEIYIPRRDIYIFSFLFSFI